LHAWHVATVQPFMELTAEEHLVRQGFEPFAPRYEFTRVTRGRKVTTEYAYFPGYIFINFDRALTQWRSINGTRGVKQLMLSSPDSPARVRDGVVEELLMLCRGSTVEAASIDRTLKRLIVTPVGARVKLTEGPFAGHTGPVTWSKGDRVKVLLSLFGSEREMKVSKRALELV